MTPEAIAVIAAAFIGGAFSVVVSLVTAVSAFRVARSQERFGTKQQEIEARQTQIDEANTAFDRQLKAYQGLVDDQHNQILAHRQEISGLRQEMNEGVGRTMEDIRDLVAKQTTLIETQIEAQEQSRAVMRLVVDELPGQVAEEVEGRFTPLSDAVKSVREQTDAIIHALAEVLSGTVAHEQRSEERSGLLEQVQKDLKGIKTEVDAIRLIAENELANVA